MENNMTVNKVRNLGYTTIIDANEGEEQFVICMSFGGGQCVVSVIQVTVDMGMTVHMAPGTLVPNTDVERVMNNWLVETFGPNVLVYNEANGDAPFSKVKGRRRN